MTDRYLLFGLNNFWEETPAPVDNPIAIIDTQATVSGGPIVAVSYDLSVAQMIVSAMNANLTTPVTSQFSVYRVPRGLWGYGERNPSNYFAVLRSTSAMPPTDGVCWCFAKDQTTADYIRVRLNASPDIPVV